MSGKIIAILSLIALTAISLIGIAFSRSSGGIRSGKEWLSWTPQQRLMFVETYVSGYTAGKTDACITAAELLAPNEKITNFSHQASADCIRRTKSYSRSASYYSDLITTFYKSCPKYDQAPDFYLMTLLTDDRVKTADDLCKEGVRTEF